MAVSQSIRSQSGKVRRVAVVGGGLAGLMTTIKLCEAGIPVDLFSLVPVRRSHSVCAQGGINASVDAMGEGDSPRVHLEETVLGGDFLANQPPVQGMTEAAPGILHMLDRMGVPFHRTPEGLLHFRRLGGSSYHRTAFAGATTGQQILYALDEQVRRQETAPVVDHQGVTIPGERMVRKLEGWDFVALVLDDGVCVGVVAQELESMKIEVFAADAVCLATGGLGMIFGRSTNSLTCTGSAAGKVFRQGAVYANGEFIQVHPTAIPGADKLRLISETARSEGGRLWVPKDPKDRRAPRAIPDKDRDYFLERMYPAYGNLVPSDIASRAVFHVCLHEGRGIFNPGTGRNEHEVYLDLTHKPESVLRSRLAGVLEIYEKFVGVDPCRNPMKVFPAVHYSMGGLWVDYERDAAGSLVVGSPRNHATSIPGLYAVGEVDYQYHGANRLGANSLLSCLYGGMVAGPAIAAYRDSLPRSSHDIPTSVFESAREQEEADYDRIVGQNQDAANHENAWRLHAELAEAMLRDCTIERHDDRLDKLLDKIAETEDRARHIRVPDDAHVVNQAAQFVRHFENMLALARAIAQGARNRDESRGAHFKPACDRRDDTRWLRTTLARYRGMGEVEFVRAFDYTCAGRSVHVTDEVDVSLVKPRERSYEQAEAASSESAKSEPAGATSGEPAHG